MMCTGLTADVNYHKTDRKDYEVVNRFSSPVLQLSHGGGGAQVSVHLVSVPSLDK